MTLSRRFKRRFGGVTASLLLLVLGSSPCRGAETDTRDRELEQVRQEVLELDRRIRELLATLSDSAREELLRELGAAADPASQAVTTPAERESAATLPSRPEPPKELPVELPAEPYFQPVESSPSVRATSDGASKGSSDGVERRSEEAEAVTLPEREGPVAPQVPAPSATPVCLSLGSLDTNGDGRLSAVDRHWRHLHLMPAGSGTNGAAEVASLYDSGVRELDLARRVYTNERREVEDLRGVDRVELTALGRRRSQSAWLALDATGLAEGGDLRLLDRAGAPLEGVQLLTRGLLFEGDEGTVPAFCEPMS